MKIRSDFVTNSSSSSFIILYKEFPEIDQETLVKYPFLKNVNNLINKIFNEDKKIQSEEEFNEWFIDRYGWGDNKTLESIFEDDEWAEKEYEKIIPKIREGFVMIKKEVEYSEEEYSSFISSLHDDENIIVIGEC